MRTPLWRKTEHRELRVVSAERRQPLANQDKLLFCSRVLTAANANWPRGRRCSCYAPAKQTAKLTNNDKQYKMSRTECCFSVLAS